MPQDERADELCVQEVGSIPWHICEAPDKETALKEPVEWNPKEEDIREKLHKMEATVDNPICQPLCVIIFACALNSFNATVCWVHKSYEIT